MLKRLKDAFNSATEMQRSAMEFAALQTTWPLIKDSLPKGDGHPVLFLPGFLTGDMFTLPLQNRVEERGYKVYGWDNGLNLGFDEKTAQHLRKRLKQIFDENGGQKVTLVGHSLGGIYARELAREFPEMVRSVITMGTPFGMMDDAAKATSEYLNNVYKFFNPNSVHEEVDHIGERGLTPPPVPTTSIFSRGDGVIDYKAALNPKAPEAENIEVYGSHIGMTFHPVTIAAVIDRLAQKEGDWKPSDRSHYKMLLFPKGAEASEIPANPNFKLDKRAHASLFDNPPLKKKDPKPPKPPKA